MARLPARPTLVQALQTSSTRAGLYSLFHAYLPNPTLAGNAILIAFTVETGVTITITDDAPGGSNTYTQLAVSSDGVNTFQLIVFAALNCTAGARHITATPSVPNSKTFSMMFGGEFYNVATASVVSGSAATTIGNSATVSAGSVTPAQDGCLILHAAACAAGTSWTSLAAGPGMSLLTGDLVDAFAVAYAVQETAATVTPTILTGGAAAFVSVAIALKPAAAGTAPAGGIRIIRAQWVRINALTAQTTWTLPFPCSGNLIIASWVGFNSADSGLTPRAIASLTDTRNNAYVLGPVTTRQFAGTPQCCYAVPASTGPENVLTLVVNGGNNVSNVLLYDVEGADTSDPFEQTVQSNNSNTTTAVETGPTLTPLKRRPGLLICCAGVNVGTLREMIGTGFLGDNPWFPEADGGETQLAEDNGWGHYYHDGTAASLTPSWTASSIPLDNAARSTLFFADPQSVISRTSLSRRAD